MATKLQMAAAWMIDAMPGETYTYHVGMSLAAERKRDKDLDRVAKAFALAAGCDPPEDERSQRSAEVLRAEKKEPPKIELFHKRVGRQTFYYARRLNSPLTKDAFVQTADPRVSAYGWRNRIKENVA